MGSMCEALAGPGDGEALTGRDDHDLSRQPARQRIEVTSARPEQTKVKAAGWASFCGLVVSGLLSSLTVKAYFLYLLDITQYVKL